MTAAQTSFSSGTGGDRRRYFAKELRCMLYGYGDDEVYKPN